MNRNAKQMIYDIQEIIAEPDYDWDEPEDIPEEMLTIDNLLEIVRTYRDKYNDVVSKLYDVDTTIAYYEDREALGLG